jgi:hypothetical protein
MIALAIHPTKRLNVCVSVAAPQDSEIFQATHGLVDLARREGRVPVAWQWGPDVRAAWSRWLDSNATKLIMIVDDTFSLPDDGRICDYCGLPVFPMVAEGVALRTVARQ